MPSDWGHHLRVTGGPETRTLRIELDGRELRYVSGLEIHATDPDQPATAVITVIAGQLDIDADLYTILRAPLGPQLAAENSPTEIA